MTANGVVFVLWCVEGNAFANIWTTFVNILAFLRATRRHDWRIHPASAALGDVAMAYGDGTT